MTVGRLEVNLEKLNDWRQRRQMAYATVQCISGTNHYTVSYI